MGTNQIELEFGILVFEGEGKPKNLANLTLRAGRENQYQTQPTYGVNSGIQQVTVNNYIRMASH